MFTNKIQETYLDDSGVVATIVGTYTGQTEKGFNGTVPASTTGFLISITFPHAGIQSVVLYSSQAVAIKTNSDTSPAQTFNLAAGQMIAWGTDHYEACPITADVTAIYVDNAQTVAATVQIRVVTP